MVSDRLLLSAVEEARRAVDRAVNETIASLFSRDRSSRLTHSQLIRINRFPSPGVREIARAAEVYERALAVIRRHVENGVQFTLPGLSHSFIYLLNDFLFFIFLFLYFFLFFIFFDFF